MGDISNNTIQAKGNVRQTNKIVTNVKGNKIGLVLVFAIVILIAVFVIKLFVGGSEKQIVGRWECTDNGELYEFTKDGQFLYLSGSSDGITAQYHVNGETLQLDVSVLWSTATVIMDLDISNGKMTWSNFIDPDDMMGVSSDTVMNFTKIK
ncbi:MAG: hypothetical protein J6D08_09165 [Lachnospiraceae bacterium]|nr:hypothetical protein [Lachnospiraceae bacterium]